MTDSELACAGSDSTPDTVSPAPAWLIMHRDKGHAFVCHQGRLTTLAEALPVAATLIKAAYLDRQRQTVIAPWTLRVLLDSVEDDFAHHVNCLCDRIKVVPLLAHDDQIAVALP